MYFEDNSVKSDRNAEIDVRQFQTEYLNFGSFVDPPIAGGRFGNSRATIERPEAGVERTTTDVGSRRSLTVQPTSLETPRLCIIKETTGATVDRGTRTEGLSQLTQRGSLENVVGAATLTMASSQTTGTYTTVPTLRTGLGPWIPSAGVSDAALFGGISSSGTSNF